MELAIDLLAKTVKANNQPIKLTRKEYALLLYFIRANKGKKWFQKTPLPNTFGVTALIWPIILILFIRTSKNLRKKMIEAGSNDYIQASYGMGYKFTDE